MTKNNNSEQFRKNKTNKKLSERKVSKTNSHLNASA